MDALLRTTKRWLQPDQLSATQVTEWVAMEQLFWALSPAFHMAIGMMAPQLPSELIKAF